MRKSTSVPVILALTVGIVGSDAKCYVPLTNPHFLKVVILTTFIDVTKSCAVNQNKRTRIQGFTLERGTVDIQEGSHCNLMACMN
jgi:hypothetical protein